jgi:Ca2+:H+ antiporter
MTVRWMLPLVPVVPLLAWAEVEPTLVFACSLAAIVPLVELMGEATERLSSRFGPVIGGLLNSTLANAPEFIIGLVALHNGLGSVVKASLTGSILVNLLVGLGAALLVGGLTHGQSRFDRHRLKTSGSMLLMCGLCFIVPAVFHIGTPEGTRGLSRELSVILLAIYGLNVLVNLLGRRDESITPAGRADSIDPTIPLWRPATTLLLAAIGLAVVSDALAESLVPTARQLGFSDTFSGIVLLGGVGGTGEVLTAIRFARAGRQELVLAATVGSTIQMVLLVAPLLVFSGMALGQPLDLCFSTFEVVAIVLTIFLTREIIADGRTTWIEGVLLLATYAILVIGFYHLPDAALVDGQEVLPAHVR